MVQLDDPARWEEALGSSSSTGEDANIKHQTRLEESDRGPPFVANVKHQTRLDESDGGPFVADIIPSRAVTDGGGPPFIIPSRPSPIVAGHPSASPSRSAIDDGGSPFEICNR